MCHRENLPCRPARRRWHRLGLQRRRLVTTSANEPTIFIVGLGIGTDQRTRLSSANIVPTGDAGDHTILNVQG